jgi:iron complex outermembrane receptor protein
MGQRFESIIPAGVSASHIGHTALAAWQIGDSAMKHASIHLLSASVAALIVPTAVLAQAAPVANAGLDEIIVTAQRTESKLQETPIAITAITPAVIADQQILSTQDIAKIVPGLNLNPVTANPSTFQVGLRGGSEQTSGLIVSEPVVGIYVDDVYRGRLQGSNFQLTDIERIEVLRGPQGTLYGRNTFSGAIKIVSRTPGPDNSWAQASIGYGSFSEWRGDASIGGKVAENLGASIALFYRDQSDGWITSPALGRKIGRESNFAGRAKLAYDNGPLRITGSVSYTDDKNDGYIPVNVKFVPDAARVDFASRVFTRDAQPAFGTDPYVNISPTISRGETDVFSATLDVAYDVGAVTLHSITGYVAVNDLFHWDITGGSNPAPGVYLSTFDRLSPSSARQWSQELQATGKAFDNRLKWLAGVYYFHETGNQDFIDTLALFGLPTFPLFSQATRTSSWAGFAQGTFALSDKTSITLGGRYTSDDKHFDAVIAPPSNIAVTLDRKFNAFTPKFGIEHRFTDDLLAYASVSRGFKAGGFNGLSRDPRVLSKSYLPQSVWAYEAGLKSEFFDRRLRANLAFFLNDITDLQQTSTRPDGTFPQENVGDARVWGIEAEFTARPVTGLDLNAAVSYNNGSFKRLDPTSDAFRAGAQNLPLVSDWTVRLGGAFEQPLGDRLKARIGANMAYTGDFFANVTNVLVISGYTRVDGFVALRTTDNRWELNLSGQNLTDTVSYVSGIVSAPFPTALTPLRPRTWMLTAKFNY